MEEKVKDVYENIKDRLSNPLIFSFIVSWLVYNWEITVALLWYDKSQFHAEGCKSIFEFIQDKLNAKWLSTALPVGLAFLYTFGMPYFKELVDFANKKATYIGKKMKTKFLKDDLYLQISSLENKLNSISDTNLLEGYWKLTKHYKEQTLLGPVLDKRDEFQVYISNRDYYIVENDSKKKKYYIADFYFNPINKDMSFKLKSYGEKGDGDVSFFGKDIICTLRLDNGHWNNLSGMQDDLNVEYRKI